MTNSSNDAALDLARAQRLARLVQWRYDPEARTFRWAQGSDAILAGLDGEGSLGQAFLRWVHPLDRARVADALGRGLAHHIEYRLALPGGEERVVHHDAETEVDELSGRVCMTGTTQDVTELRAAEYQVTRLAYYDELTSLPNRAHACRFLTAAIATAKLRGQRIAILSLDLDHFKRVNDSLGHVAGNALLREIASRLREVVSADAARRGRPEPMVARLGGDEFAVILSDVRSDQEAPQLFRLMCARLSSPYSVTGAQIVVSFSAGISSYPVSGGDSEALLMRADSAMHDAKDRGRGGYQVFAPAIEEKLQRRVDVEARLRAALASGAGLELHYQPKVEASSGCVLGVEALLRWVPDAVGNISPLELVAVAEETGLIIELGEWVLRTACKQAKEWSLSSTLAIPVAVNISARQFSTTNFAETVARVLDETELSPCLLELEITEGVLMTDVSATGKVLEQLRATGLHVALDDFGTGYSSLAYLTRFPIDTLKIDRSFVVGIGIDPKSEAIITAIIALSRSLGIGVVAEGVETEAQRAFLKRFGRVSLQGWLYSKALPGPAAFTWIVAQQGSLVQELQATG